MITTIVSFGAGEVFFALLAVGDMPLALGTIVGLPWVFGRAHRELPPNRLFA